jgi:hypothetical protein
VTFCIHDLETLHALTLFRPSLLLNCVQHLQLTIRLPLCARKDAVPDQASRAALIKWRECCQKLDQANLASMYLWLDVVDPPTRGVLYTVPGDMNPYIFGERLSKILTVDIPINPERPEMWKDVADLGFKIRPRGWPRFEAQSERGRRHLVVRVMDEAEPGVAWATGPARTFVHQGQDLISQMFLALGRE